MNHATARFFGHLADEDATIALGAALARVLAPGLHLNLHGDLGAGKTTLVRAMLRALGHTGTVKSPTYGLIESYRLPNFPIESGNHSNIYFYHFDFYRFNRESDWLDAGLRDFFGTGSICVVEWPENAGDLLPSADIEIRLDITDTGRDATLLALTPAGAACLARLEPPPALRQDRAAPPP